MLDRNALLCAQSALPAVRESVVLRHGQTASFDNALASIRAELAHAAAGSAATQTDQTKYVDTAEAAKRLRCSDRHVRDIAPRIGGIRIGGRWMIPDDSLP